MDEKRLEAFEKMLDAVLSQYDSTTERWRGSKRMVKKKRPRTVSCLRISCNIRT